MENPLAIANYFIGKSIDTGERITPMKLIKLVYISHGWYLALTNEPLLPEGIQAWKYGPVVDSIYREAKKYGNARITSQFFDKATNTYPIPSGKEVINFLDKIWQVYGRFDGLQLSALTHKEGTPWFKTWYEGGGSKYNGVIIGNDLIKEHYKSKITINTNEQAIAT